MRFRMPFKKGQNDSEVRHVISRWPTEPIVIQHTLTHRYDKRPSPDAVEVSIIDERGQPIRQPIRREVRGNGDVVQYYFRDLGVGYSGEGYDALPESWRNVRLDVRTVYYNY